MSEQMTGEQLEALCAEWQRILRLQDWTVKVTFARHFDMDDSEGVTSYQHRWKTADIKILDPVDFGHIKAARQDAEQVLVHELLHLHVAGFEPTETHALAAFEQGIDLMAWALVNLRRESQ